MAVVVGALVMAGCSVEIDSVTRSETIDGSGDVTTETIDASAVSGIRICCDLVVEIEFEEGSDELIELTIDDNLHDELSMTTDGETLEIEPRRNNVNVRPTSPMVLRISGHEINGLTADSSSRVFGTFPDVDVFAVAASSDAVVEANVDADELMIKADSSSSVSGNFGSPQQLTVNASTDAQVKIIAQAVETVIGADTSASVSLSGRATSAMVSASTDAVVDLRSATVDSAEVHGDTSADIKLETSGPVSGRMSTDAKLQIWGDPDLDVATETSGAVVRNK